MTLPSALYHHHTRGMMEAAAHAIAEQLRLRLLLQEQKAIIEMLDEGVVVLEGDGTIRTLNNKAQAMLDLPPDAVHGNIQDIIFSSDIIRAILSESGQFSDQEAFLQLKGGSLNCMLSLTRLESGKGRVLTLRETKRIKESAVRVTGAKAVYTFDHIVGNAPATQEVVRMARMAAQSDVTTLILGESGTGKELFAQSIHNGGRRANAPFVVVNCGALPRNLVQSELFGYDEGSFTGASRLGKPGKFELADGGTLFLDEIGESSASFQAKLLRILQEGEMERVGGDETLRVNVLIIAATNRHLEEEVRLGHFREDLYYRLNVMPIALPPLRERREDIPRLARHFLQIAARELGVEAKLLHPETETALTRLAWPGNVRQLENTCRWLTVMAAGQEVLTQDLPSELFETAIPDSPTHMQPDSWATLLGQWADRALRSGHQNLLSEAQPEMERTLLTTALRHTQGHKQEAARLLGWGRNTLTRKLKELGME